MYHVSASVHTCVYVHRGQQGLCVCLVELHIIIIIIIIIKVFIYLFILEPGSHCVTLGLTEILLSVEIKGMSYLPINHFF